MSVSVPVHVVDRRFGGGGSVREEAEKQRPFPGKKRENSRRRRLRLRRLAPLLTPAPLARARRRSVALRRQRLRSSRRVREALIEIPHKPPQQALRPAVRPPPPLLRAHVRCGEGRGVQHPHGGRRSPVVGAGGAGACEELRLLRRARRAIVRVTGSNAAAGVRWLAVCQPKDSAGGLSSRQFAASLRCPLQCPCMSNRLAHPHPISEQLPSPGVRGQSNEHRPLVPPRLGHGKRHHALPSHRPGENWGLCPRGRRRRARGGQPGACGGAAAGASSEGESHAVAGSADCQGVSQRVVLRTRRGTAQRSAGGERRQRRRSVRDNHTDATVPLLHTR